MRAGTKITHFLHSWCCLVRLNIKTVSFHVTCWLIRYLPYCSHLSYLLLLISYPNLSLVTGIFSLLHKPIILTLSLGVLQLTFCQYLSPEPSSLCTLSPQSLPSSEVSMCSSLHLALSFHSPRCCTCSLILLPIKILYSRTQLARKLWRVLPIIPIK